MARWLLHSQAAHIYANLPAAASSPSFLVVAAGLFLSLCCIVAILSTCSFCDNYRKRVGDKASSSDGDASPPGRMKTSFFMSTKKMTAMHRLSNTSEEELNVGAREQGSSSSSTATEQQQQQQQQQQGKMSPNVWQRTILMGERCQRPTFSGLVLYDEKGNPLPRRLPSSALEQKSKM